MSHHRAHPFDDDKLKEECGIFGVIGVGDASNFVALGLHALQHRGQEAGGIVAYEPTSGWFGRLGQLLFYFLLERIGMGDLFQRRFLLRCLKNYV